MQEINLKDNSRSTGPNQKGYIEWLYWGFFLVSIMLKCFYFQFTTQANQRPFITSVNINMLISSLAITLILVALVFMIFNKRRNEALFVMNLLLITVLVADTNFYRYYYNAITLPVFYQFNFKMVGSVNSSIMSLFKPKDIIYLLDLPFMLLLLIFINKKVRVSRISFTRRFAAGILTLTFGVAGFTGVYKKVDIQAFHVDNNYVVKNMGVFYFHFYDAKEFFKETFTESDQLTEEEKDKILTFYQRKEDFDNTIIENPYRGIAADKNLIMVQIEAMQGFVINRKIMGKEITPNLNKLIKESLYFDNIYYQVAEGNTSDAEFLANTSLYPLGEGSVYHRFPENKYHSLANILKERGYATYACHAFDPSFWNRQEIYKSLGFDQFLNKNEFVLDEFAGWDGASALSDASFFRQSLDKIDTSNPFYSFLITLSSHHPFKYFEDFDFDVGEFEGTYIGNYIKAANYADQCIGGLLEELKERGLDKNTLLVLYGDHSAVPKYLSQELFDFIGEEYSEWKWTQLQKVPLIIHDTNIKAAEVTHTTGGQIDILPTIMNLMDMTSEYALGKDLLNTEKGFAILRNSSIVTDDYEYLSNPMGVYDVKTGNLLEMEEYSKEVKSLIQQLEISETLITKDAFRNEIILKPGKQ